MLRWLRILSILDHDLYFRITGRLLTEDAAGVLATYDEVLRKGFEGEVFILGLAEHFRNLLVCKDRASAGLLEVSDDIQHLYHEQAALTPQDFLLNALQISNQCDIHYKTARNKRLHVELALLKMAYLSSRLQQFQLEGEKN